MNDDKLDEQLEALKLHLPEELRSEWVVLPKRELQKAVVVGMLLGASATLLVVGLVLDTHGWAWPFVALLLAMSFAARFVPWWRGDRFVEQLGSVRREAGEQRAGGDQEVRPD